VAATDQYLGNRSSTAAAVGMWLEFLIDGAWG